MESSHKNSQSTFVIIDGNAILHRAYHAYPPLTKNGEPVGAVYGFFAMLFKMLDTIRPAYVAVCFDRPKPTFRQALYAGYQQHRPQMADDLSPQIKTIHDLLKTANIQIFEVDGYEADDLIGTLATQSIDKLKLKIEDSPGQVIIVSGDRDMLQLVNSHVKLLMPQVGISKTVLFGEREVFEKYGVHPKQFIDYKALIGDASDGYPGVTGIGPKTASKLLQQYETFEKLYESIPDLPQAIGEKLAIDAEQAALAKRLATIVTDAPITLDCFKCSIAEFNRKNLQKRFQELEFNSLLSRFPHYLLETIIKQEKGLLQSSAGTQENRSKARLRSNGGQGKKSKQLGLI